MVGLTKGRTSDELFLLVHPRVCVVLTKDGCGMAGS